MYFSIQSGVPCSAKPLIVNRDRLQEHHAIRCEEAVGGREVVVVVLETDRLEHLDADDLVELPGQFAIVRATPRCAPLPRRSATAIRTHGVCSSLIVVVVTRQP